VLEDLEARIREGRHLLALSDDRARPAGDQAAPAAFLGPEDVGKGEAHFRELTNQAAVEEPLLRCPAVLPLAFGDLVLGVASGYLGCFPGLGTLNLRRSYRNGLPEFDTNHFHSDPNSPRFVKAFFYLNDVDEEGGPFCYVKGSAARKFPGWRGKYRWTEEEIRRAYGPDCLVSLTGSVGDVLFADTTGFHRGTKVRSRDRSMLTLNYLVHPEDVRFRLPADAHRSLSPLQQAAAEFLQVV
jgi:hypothetical protein